MRSRHHATCIGGRCRLIDCRGCGLIGRRGFERTKRTTPGFAATAQDKLHGRAFPWSLSKYTRRQTTCRQTSLPLGLFLEYTRGQTTQRTDKPSPGTLSEYTREQTTQGHRSLLWHPFEFARRHIYLGRIYLEVVFD